MKDDEEKPRGYAYIEFHSKDGLTKALLASGAPFKGRTLNMDVAKPSRNATNRPSYNNNREFGDRDRERYGERDNKERYGERDKERYDTNWGPSANKNYGFPNRSSYSNRMDNRPPGERRELTERPRLNINPPAPKPSAQATELHDNISKPKGSFENPFGTANLDRQKMDEMAQARLAKDMEREKRERDKRDEQFRNQQQPQTRRVQTPRDTESKTAASWRTNKPAAAVPARGIPAEPAAKPVKKLIQDEDGFFTKGRNREVREEKTETPIPATKPVKRVNNTDVDDKNIFSTLSEIND
jgi:hypothetical protein